jgi:hypothetical protein
MFRGLLAAACFLPACAAHVPAAAPAAPVAAGDPHLALSALVTAPVDPEGRDVPRPRRVGRLSPPFSIGAPARNVLARAPSETHDRDIAAR